MEKHLINYLRAGFTCFWLTTTEPTRVKEIYYDQLPNYKMENGAFKVTDWTCLKGAKPEEPLQALCAADPDTVMFLYNYHFWIKKPSVIQIIQDYIPEWANTGKSIVIVSAVQDIPPELEKDFTLLSLDLPQEEEIIDIVHKACPEEKFIPKEDHMKEVVKASKSLTARELENVYSLSLVEKKALDVITINDYRAQAIKKSGFAEVMKTDVTFDDVIGYERPKAQVLDTIHNPDAKGVIWIGPPGTGKTTLGKAIANESKKLGLKVDTSRFLSKFQGESGRLLDDFFKLVIALGDCYLFLDEFDKQFAGTTGSGDLDAGTGKKMIGKWLDFLQERPKGVYINATCNSFVGVPPALFRVGRWDSAPWYVGLPSQAVRDKMMIHFIKKFELTEKQTEKIPLTDNWTGAEIEALCHNAKMRGLTLKQASQFVLPMYDTCREEIAELEQWAKGRAIPSEDVPLIKARKPNAKARKLDLS